MQLKINKTILVSKSCLIGKWSTKIMAQLKHASLYQLFRTDHKYHVHADSDVVFDKCWLCIIIVALPKVFKQYLQHTILKIISYSRTIKN